MNESPHKERETAISRVLESLIVQHAHHVILDGDLDAADKILSSDCNLSSNPAAMDLLARIAVQRGEFGRAASIWKSVLELDPGNSPARAALSRLASPWRAIAIAQRIGWLACIALAIFLCGLGLVYLFLGATSAASRSVVMATPNSYLPPEASPIVTDLDPERTEDHVATTRLEASPEIQDDDATLGVPEGATSFYTEPTVDKPSVPVFEIPGCRTYADNAELVIVFDDGLFRSWCKLAEQAEIALTDAATALTNGPPIEKLMVQGHTDEDPVLPGSRYRNNSELGFARAGTIARWLSRFPGIPPQALVASSKGTNDPPFPDADDRSGQKNRTVVLRVRFAEVDGERTE